MNFTGRMYAMLLAGFFWLLPMSLRSQDFVVDGIGYSLDSDSLSAGVTCLSDVDREGTLVIPQQVRHEGRNYPVTFVMPAACSDCMGLTKVEIPRSVRRVEEVAFSGCSSLREVVLPDTLDFLGEGAFYGCSSLTKVTLPKVLETWGYGVFRRCTSLESIDIPYVDETLGGSFFGGCTSLSEVRLGDSVRTVAEEMFYGCTSLREISVPASVSDIGCNPFSGCTSLGKISVAADNPHYMAVDNVLFDRRQDTLLACAPAKKGVYAVPPTVSAVREYAFKDCSSLEGISFPASVTEIGEGALEGCTALASLKVEPGNPVYETTEDGMLIDKNRRALLRCPAKKKGRCVVPPTVEIIDKDAFEGCASLTEVILPASVTEIYGDMFGGCSSLGSIQVAPDNPVYASADGILFSKDGESLLRCPPRRKGMFRIPDGVSLVGSQAFVGCSHLTGIVVPAFVEEIGPGAFRGCARLASIEVEEGNPAYASADGVLFDMQGTTLVQCPGGRKSYRIPETVCYIGEWAFADCTSLLRLEMPASVREVGACAFVGCNALREVYVHASGFLLGECSAFDQSYPSTCVLHVPAGQKRNFQTNECWGSFKTVVDDLPPLSPDE